MMKVGQGFKYIIIPVIASVAAHRIMRNVGLTTATFFGGMALVYGIRNHRETTFQVLRPTIAALAVGTLIYAATKKIEASVPFGALAGIGTVVAWPKTIKKSGDPLQPVRDQIKAIHQAVGKSLNSDKVEALRLVVSDLEELLKSLNGAAEKIKEDVQLALRTAQALIDSFFSSKKQAEEAAKDKAMQVALEKMFDVIRVDGDGSCMPRAILALVDNEIRPNLKNLENSALNLQLTPKVKKLREKIADFVTEHAKDEQVIKIVTNSFDAKKIKCQVLDAYCDKIKQMNHWFGHGEMTLTAAHLKVNIATYSGAPVTDNQGKLICSIVPLEEDNRHDKTIHIWLKQSTKHYWILLPKKEV